jgi:hypothetical protein
MRSSLSCLVTAAILAGVLTSFGHTEPAAGPMTVKRFRDPVPASALAVPEPPKPDEQTLLDQDSRLPADIPDATVRRWQREVKRSPAGSRRAVMLHLRLGEYRYAELEQAEQALWHFRTAATGAKSGAAKGTHELWRDEARGLAAYNSAIVYYRQGAYEKATHAFKRLLSKEGGLPGYDRRTCTLWSKHAAACFGYHEVRRKAGITEPERVDPYCGAAGVAMCFRALGLPTTARLSSPSAASPASAAG